MCPEVCFIAFIARDRSNLRVFLDGCNAMVVCGTLLRPHLRRTDRSECNDVLHCARRRIHRIRTIVVREGGARYSRLALLVMKGTCFKRVDNVTHLFEIAFAAVQELWFVKEVSGTVGSRFSVFVFLHDLIAAE